MKLRTFWLARAICLLASVVIAGPRAGAQAPAAAAAGQAAPTQAAQRPPNPNATFAFRPEWLLDRQVTFRLYAPQAQTVLVRSEFKQLMNTTAPLAKADNGVWSLTLGPVDAGVYRYLFIVDGVSTADPRNPDVSGSLNNVQSVFTVPRFGISRLEQRYRARSGRRLVSYYSDSLGAVRRMHIYTPPGYDGDQKRYPVFYLLHGAGDNDDAWTSVGHANVILDNLIAAGKAKPMIVVMPAGHVTRVAAGWERTTPINSARIFCRVSSPMLKSTTVL